MDGFRWTRWEGVLILNLEVKPRRDPDGPGFFIRRLSGWAQISCKDGTNRTKGTDRGARARWRDERKTKERALRGTRPAATEDPASSWLCGAGGRAPRFIWAAKTDVCWSNMGAF